MPKPTFYNLNQEKKNTILNVAIKAFTAGYDQASINQIVKDSNISKGSFYQYFSDKEDLFMMILEMIGQKKKDLLSDLFARIDHMTLLDFYETAAIRTLKWMDEEPDLQAISVWLYRETPKTLKSSVIEENKKWAVQFYQGLVERDIKRGHIRAEVNAEILSQMLVMFATEMLIDAMRNQLPLETIIKETIAIIRKGVEQR